MAISARIARKGAELVLIDVRNRTAEYLRKKSEKKVHPGKTVKIEYWALGVTPNELYGIAKKEEVEAV